MMNSTLKLTFAFVAGLIVATLGCANNRPSHLSGSNLFESNSELAMQVKDPVPVNGSRSQKTLITLDQGQNLNRLINVEGVVLIDFYADWCGPCRTQAEVLHQMEATAVKKDAKIIKVNIDDHPQLAKQFNVTSLPTLLAFKNGDIAERQIGLANKTRIASLLNK